MMAVGCVIGHEVEQAMARRVKRIKRLNPYRPSTDFGLMRVMLILIAIIGILITGSVDCRFEFIPVGFC